MWIAAVFSARVIWQLSVRRFDAVWIKAKPAADIYCQTAIQFMPVVNPRRSWKCIAMLEK